MLDLLRGPARCGEARSLALGAARQRQRAPLFRPPSHSWPAPARRPAPRVCLRAQVFLECGHGGVCLACAQRCLRNRGRHCPMCRQHIGQVVQINPQQARYEGSAIVQVHEAGAHILDQLDSLATEGGEPPAETAEEAAQADDGALPPARPPGRRTFPRFSRASMRR